MPRDRRAVSTTEVGRSRLAELRDDGTLPRYHDGHGFYERPHVQWSKKSNWPTRLAVFTANDFTCQHCGYRPAAELIPADYDGSRTIGRLVVDHIDSLSTGGAARDLANLQTLCVTCNGRKC